MKRTITIQRKAHFYLQIPNQKITQLLIVIHGYGQNAEDFLDEFKSLKNSDILVVAPEAISKFYNKKGEAVANWMTSLERLDEIDDYCKYLNQLLDTIKKDYEFSQLSVLGFSQGVSTAFRWISTLKDNPGNFYVCAGSVPLELTANDFKNSTLTINYYYGDEDKLLKEEKAMLQIERIKQLGLKVNTTKFKGRHEVPKECLVDIIS